MEMAEHHRTHTRHIVSEYDQPDIGTRVLCGKVLTTSPGEIHGDGDMCKTCAKIAEKRGIVEDELP